LIPIAAEILLKIRVGSALSAAEGLLSAALPVREGPENAEHNVP